MTGAVASVVAPFVTVTVPLTSTPAAAPTLTVTPADWPYSIVVSPAVVVDVALVVVRVSVFCDAVC